MDFFWDVHSFQREPVECPRHWHVDNCYPHSSFYTLVWVLTKHMDRAGGRIANRALVLELLAVLRAVVKWRYFDYYIEDSLEELQTSLVERILSWPQRIGAPFLEAIGKLMQPHIMSQRESVFGKHWYQSQPYSNNMTAYH